MRIAICDDEPLFCEKLSKECRNIFALRHIEYEEDIFFNGHDLLSSANEPDILFLDIDMPQQDGIQVAEQIKKSFPDCAVIFVTSHFEKARLGYKVDAFRFLLKPLDVEELGEAINGAMRRINDNKMLVIDEKHIKAYITLKEIIYVEAIGSGCVIYTEKQHYITNKPLVFYEAQLKDELFVRIHKSFIVSLKHILSLTDNSTLIMSNRNVVPVSRRLRGRLKESMLAYVKKNAI